MAAEELGGGVHDNVGTVLQWANQVGACHRVVDDQREPVGVCDTGNTFKVENVDAGVGNGFTKECFGVGLDGLLPCIKVILVVNKGDGDSELGKRVLEQVVGSAIDRR